MELFLVHARQYSKLFREEDAFFYPLALRTPLLQARYVGKPLTVRLKGLQLPLKGLFLGVIDQTLYSYFYKHLGKDALALTSLSFGENEQEWLTAHTNSKTVFAGVKHFGNPREPPYTVVMTELGEWMLFTAFSEAEQVEPPQINFNLVITNEAIEKLERFLKRQLPLPKLVSRKKVPAAAKPHAEKQLHLKKFG